ncbi:response regulator transcription factor [Edaphobacter modestus]|uniref:Two-component system copper resistance phosphate regulon response regulator CusR n=1 Tax=Edaphobacter modestus TaxID=388466 RepID=A0A4V2G5B7_9BACT|nr:response regulator transcription factor [Edaphobacter modestus]RZU43676.1 two-component system copper resistance phosphate regulon response regulator CusR [Edaphobacter modestus]
MNVLVIEDDRKISSLLERGLSEHGHRVSIAGNGREGAEMMVGGGYDVALLDILLPGIDGLAVLERVRAKRCKTAIMMLTAVDTVPKVLEAFDLGADDYLVKPFLLEILLARLTAIARRGQSPAPPLLQVGDLILDRSRRSVRRNGRSIHMTRKQFDLLELLMRRSGLVATREDLVEAAWGYLADVKDNTLDVYVHGLRSKLELQSYQQQITIRTVHGTGYMLVTE